MVTVRGAIRRDDTILRLGGSGGPWRLSWAADDSQFVYVSDGTGPPNASRPVYNSRVYTVAGGPTNPRFGDLPGYPELGLDVKAPLYYGFALLAVGEQVYQFLSTLNASYAEDADGLRFIGAKLIHSGDAGATWCNQDGSTPVIWEDWSERSRETMVFFEEPQDTFSQLSFLQMGPGYAWNTDGFVYLYSPNGNTDQTATELVMLRVPKDRVRDRGAYEYFAELRPDGGASWTRDIGGRGVVCTYPRGWLCPKMFPYAWHPSVVYNAGLGLYMMASWGMGCSPHGMWFSKPSYLGLWISPTPWGPWEQIHEENPWTPGGDGASRAYRPEIAPKWVAEDGRSFWLVWNDFQSRADPASSTDETGRGSVMPFYAFNTQRVDLLI